MLKRSLTFGLMFALSIGGAVWTKRSATAMSVTGQVIDTAGGSVSLNIDGGTNAELSELTVGGRVRVDALSGVAEGARVARAKRRPLLGLSGLAMVGVAIFLRLRRPLTF
jgi:hypothetical protein